MASDSQLALARPPRIQSHVPKAARQIVPAFLQKLYQMVNDDKNRDLITWSEAGDSFFVLDHERFAREVLGHWFKHQRFSSFVRQLNMYGFHKIPHLQQGVLRSDSDTEYWNFTHPNFRRDQPDLLCLIQRKKQSAALAQDGVVDIRDPNTPTTTTTSNPPAITNPPISSSPTISLTQGQLLDMHSIIQGIAAIKRHQTTISSELTELKQSNQILYSESRIARSKLQNQQELIDRILKFLAGVFGSTHSASAGSGGGGGGGGGHRGRKNASSDELDALMRGSDANKAVIPTRRRSAGGRLMIEAAKVSEGSGKPGIVELEDLREGPLGDEEEEDVTMSENNFNSNYAVETPVSIPSPSPSENTAATIGETKDRPDITTHPTPTAPTQPSPPSPQTNTHLELERALTPSNNHHNDTFEINQPWANIFGGRNGITNDQLSHLLAVLASNGNVTSLDESLGGFEHQGVAGFGGGGGGGGGGGQDGGGDVGLGFGGQGVVQPGQIQGGGGQSTTTTTTGGNQLTYPPPPFTPGGFDFASFLQGMSPPSSAGLPPPLPSASTSTSFQQQQSGSSSYGLLQDSLGPSTTEGGASGARLERQFQSTQEVEEEVSEMDKQMNQWMEQLGPILGGVVGGDVASTTTGTGTAGMGTTAGMGMGSAVDGVIPQTNGLDELDFDSFLNISSSSSVPGSSRGVGVGVGVDDDDEDDFEDEDEEDEEFDISNLKKGATTMIGENGGSGRKRKSDVMMEVVLDGNGERDGVGEGGGVGKMKRRRD